jgi:hypothetical protein
MTPYECPCPGCKFAAINGEPVREASGKVLRAYTDSQGVHHEVAEGQVP